MIESMIVIMLKFFGRMCEREWREVTMMYADRVLWL